MKKYYKFEMNVKIMKIFTITIFILGLLIFKNKINLLSLFNLENHTNIFKFLLICFLIPIWAIIHELIHGLFYYLTGTKKENISFGIALEKGLFYCLTNQEIKKFGVLISLIAPFFFIGIVTLIIGLFINSSILIILSISNIAGASGDLIMFIYFITLNNFLYTEMGEPTNFGIITNKDLSKTKHFGLNLIESGNYKKDMFKVNIKRINISKKSLNIFKKIIYVFVFYITFLIILFIISLFIIKKR